VVTVAESVVAPVSFVADAVVVTAQWGQVVIVGAAPIAIRGAVVDVAVD
jgi:hypothetical protein